jgi:uncharacterized membrane protein
VSWKDLIPLILVIFGIVLFLQGANYYNQLTGWGGVILIAAGIIAEIALWVYSSTTKKESS